MIGLGSSGITYFAALGISSGFSSSVGQVLFSLAITLFTLVIVSHISTRVLKKLLK